MKTFLLRHGGTCAEICIPDCNDGIYRGTRFDHAGVFRSLDYDGHKYVSQWYDRHDPYCHDAVCGPSEEFSQIGYDFGKGSAPFLKIGVGVLRSATNQYDRFFRYDVLDFGKRSLDFCSDRAVFCQEISFESFSYTYLKEIMLGPDGTLSINHVLKNTGSLSLDFDFYNHNFFVLDGAPTGVATRFSFPFSPTGTWRSEYDSVHLTEHGIEFLRDIQKGETVFMGNLVPSSPMEGYSFRLENVENKLCVDVASRSQMEFAVFWSNHRVSCLEPYTHFEINPGDEASWSIHYRLGVLR